VRKLEKRNLFQKIFGPKQKTTDNMTRFELLKTSNNTFYSWSGNLFDSDIVRAAIRPKANAIGKLNAKHIKGFGAATKINQDAYIRGILANPNPYMSMQDFLSKMTFQREINHNAFAYVKRDENGYPLEIYPIPFSGVELYEQAETLFVKFDFWTGKTMVVPYTDLIHLRKDFNDSDFFGDQGTTSLNSIMEVITTTDQSVVNAIKNSAIIKWIMKFKSVLQPKDVEMQLSEFTKNYLDISNTGGAAASDPRYDLEQVKDNSYVPNALQMEKAIQRLYSYFGVNEAIVQNKYDENGWNAFYESEIEVIAIQLSNAFTKAFFSRREIGYGNKIVFDSCNLAYASMSTKLQLVAMVDRGALSPNEWRTVLNLAPVEGGDEMLRRLDTTTVNDADTKPVEGGDLVDNKGQTI